MKDIVNLEKIRTIAENYYAEGDFYCSEAIIKTIIDEFGIDTSYDAIKMASGFPVGVGGKGCVCGAISGGVMAIGLVFGRSEAKDPAVNKAMELSGLLHDKFISLRKSTCCRVLTKGMNLGSSEHIKQCVMFTGDVAYEAARLIAENLNIKTE